MGNTKENLEAAFAGESQANRKYLFFAEKANEEGYPQIARLFRAAAEAETVHAKNHLNTLGGITSTADNLKVAISGENYEFTQMYPEFIKQAETENNQQAITSFDLANKVERVHHRLYERALKSLGGVKILKMSLILSASAVAIAWRVRHLKNALSAAHRGACSSVLNRYGGLTLTCSSR